MAKYGLTEPTPKLHSVQHPDVSDEVLSLQAFSTECKKILMEGDSADGGLTKKPYYLKGASLSEVAAEMAETEEYIATLKNIMEWANVILNASCYLLS